MLGREQDRRQPPHHELREIVREEVEDAVKTLADRVETIQAKVAKWETAWSVLRWAIGGAIVTIEVIGKVYSWAKEHLH